MKNLACITVLVGMIFGTVGPAWGGGFGLSGSKFAIKGEYLYVAEIGLPFSVGDTFQNCYTFQDDLTPEDGFSTPEERQRPIPLLQTMAQDYRWCKTVRYKRISAQEMCD